MNVEEIFIKDEVKQEPKENLDIQVVEKPKRKLTEKQKKHSKKAEERQKQKEMGKRKKKKKK